MKLFIFYLAIAAILAVPALGQPGLPGPPDQTPIDGLWILALLGGSYAIKKLRLLKKT